MQKRIDDLSFHPSALSPDGKMLIRYWTRLRDTPPSLFLSQLAAWCTFLIWRVANDISLIQKLGIESWFPHAVYASIPTPFLMSVAFRFGVSKCGDLAEHPARFLAILTSGTITGGALLISILLAQKLIPSSVEIHTLLLFYLSAMLSIMPIHGIFSWLYVLHSRRADDRAKLANLWIRRSALAQRIAQSKLLAARAQIAPEMVARILRTVQIRYSDNSDGASFLLDTLIDYLRLAMNRMRENNPPLATELALITSYLKLYEAETGVCVEVHANIETAEAEGRGAISLPLFVVVRKIFDASDDPPMIRPVLHIFVQQGKMALELETVAIPVDKNNDTALLKRLRDVTNDGLITLHHTFTSGVNRYVFQISSI
jgi:hypothetical protein